MVRRAGDHSSYCSRLLCYFGRGSCQNCLAPCLHIRSDSRRRSWNMSSNSSITTKRTARKHSWFLSGAACPRHAIRACPRAETILRRCIGDDSPDLSSPFRTRCAALPRTSSRTRHLENSKSSSRCCVPNTAPCGAAHCISADIVQGGDDRRDA